MTISTEVRKAGPFIGNGSASSFPFAFKVFKAADLIVVRRQDSIGVETTLVLDSDYHVTLNVNQDTTPGGVVTLTGGALADGFTLIVSSELPYLQTTDLTNQGGFYPKVITNALDRLTIFCQQLAENLGRTLKLPITAPTNISTEIPLPNPSELLAWNETGTGLTTVSPQSLVTSIAYGTATADLFAGDGVTTTFPLTTSPASVNNLDVSIGGHSQRPVQGGIGDYSWNGGASITFVVPPPAPTVPGDKNVLVRYMQAIPVSDSEALHAQTREALRRSYAEAGGALVAGSFETGGVLTAATDVLLQESTGSTYAWTGALPKTVAPGFDPVGVVGFELRTDVLLRDELEAIKHPVVTIGTAIENINAVTIDRSSYAISPLASGIVSAINASVPPLSISVGGVVYPLGLISKTIDGRITPESMGYSSGDAADFMNLMASIPGRYALRSGVEYPVQQRLVLQKNGVSLDLNGATLKWSGAPVSPPCDFATMRDTKLFIKIGESSSDGSTPFENIEIYGGTLDANGQGIGIFARGVKGLKLHDFTLKNSQGAGIDIQRCVGYEILDFTLLDCACDPSKSWSSTELEAYSDGINVWVGSQLGTIRRGEIINTRQSAASAKVARAGIVVEGYGVNGIETRDNTIENVRVRGYDRQFHAEACGSNTIRNCDFQTINSTDKKTFGVAAIVWAVSSKIKFDNCRIVGDDMCLKLTSANDASFAHCEIGITGSGNFMQNSEYASDPAGAYNKKVVFDDCTLNFGNGGSYFNGGNYTFSDCKLFQGAANTASNFNLGSYLFDACQFNNLMFQSTTGEAGKEFITIRDVEFSGYTSPASGGHTALRTGVSGNASVRLINPRTSQAKADVVFSCDDYLYIESPQCYQDFVDTFTLTGSRNDTYYNGDLYLPFSPTNGTHKIGQRCWNTNPTGATPVTGWICTASGTPGTWVAM